MPKLDRFRIATARRLRSTMTDEERILWSQIWRIPVEGTHFRKQASFGVYYPDFISHRLKLIIEIDGAQHGFNYQKLHDEKRTLWLQSQGYRVLRFWNHEVRQELDSVLDTIYAAVAEQSALVALDGKAVTDRSVRYHPTPALTRRPSPSRGG